MGSTFFSLHYHMVFSTKGRQPLIRADWRPHVHSYLGGIIRGMNGVAEIVGRDRGSRSFVNESAPVTLHCRCYARSEEGFKRLGKENFDRSFSWQEGYAAFTVSPSATDSVRRYIADQERHHARNSFVDELKELLEKAGIEYDEKYLL